MQVQVFIDGTLAGVSWPFPILFSGADDPDLWRPIGGIDILDLKEYEIDSKYIRLNYLSTELNLTLIASLVHGC